MNEGWICPRCGRVNAPFTPYCDCKDVSSNSCECNHDWLIVGGHVTDTHTRLNYMCKKCGKEKSTTISKI